MKHALLVGVPLPPLILRYIIHLLLAPPLPFLHTESNQNLDGGKSWEGKPGLLQLYGLLIPLLSYSTAQVTCGEIVDTIFGK